ncbi:hypothetical protein LTR84_002528 [Exophiala bonariae]|uniref:Uncharacterized protein n=1 Tax=Exophiala bonariae TaxID=1690606 RepID=A0AAV9N9R1_9EURO|nr:hypothetical protein LTR84_002528 [Exophiala bonariae]
MPEFLAETGRLLLELLEATADLECNLTDERSMLIHDIRNEIESSMTIHYPSPKSISTSKAQFIKRRQNLRLGIERGKAISEASEAAKKLADAAEKMESSKSGEQEKERGNAGLPSRKRKWESDEDWERSAGLTEGDAQFDEVKSWYTGSHVLAHGHWQATQRQGPQPYHLSSRQSVWSGQRGAQTALTKPHRSTLCLQVWVLTAAASWSDGF